MNLYLCCFFKNHDVVVHIKFCEIINYKAVNEVYFQTLSDHNLFRDKVTFKNFGVGAPGWLSQLSVWLRLRSWSPCLWVRAPRRALWWQLRAWSLFQILCLILSLPLPHLFPVFLCLSRINKCKRKLKKNCHRLWVWSSLLSCKRTGCRIENVREANVWEETRALNKGPCSVLIKIRRLTSVMDVHKETMKLWTLTHGRGAKGVLKICGLRSLGQ